MIDATRHFTSDWFSHNIQSWQNIFRRIGWDARSKKTIVEIGSYEGLSSLWISENLLRNANSTLHCVDVFPDAAHPDSYFKRFERNMRSVAHSARIMVHTAPSFHFLTHFIAAGQRADFVYVDGSHRASDVLEDLVLSFRALNNGGLIICDDYLGGAPGDAVLNTPKIAVDAMTNIYRDQIEIIAGQSLYQFAFVKIRERDFDDPTSRGMVAAL